jgi:DNA-binding IclR family transcriptional regulator
MGMHGEQSSRTVQSVQTTIEILEHLREVGGAGVTELATALNHSKGTVHSHLATLVENEYVVRNGERYGLSLKFLDLGEYVKSRLDIYDVVVKELNDLATETGEVAQFATEEHGRTVYLYKAHGDQAVNTASSVGKREYSHCISLGKAMLAQFPDERVDEIAERHGLPAKTPNTITEREELAAELRDTRERGYAVDEEEMIEGIRCVAAPITNDGVVGAISISGPSGRMAGERFEEKLPSKLLRSANVIEINAKFR